MSGAGTYGPAMAFLSLFCYFDVELVVSIIIQKNSSWRYKTADRTGCQWPSMILQDHWRSMIFILS